VKFVHAPVERSPPNWRDCAGPKLEYDLCHPGKGACLWVLSLQPNRRGCRHATLSASSNSPPEHRWLRLVTVLQEVPYGAHELAFFEDPNGAIDFTDPTVVNSGQVDWPLSSLIPQVVSSALANTDRWLTRCTRPAAREEDERGGPSAGKLERTSRQHSAIRTGES
jgi:hypothetical protein